jgi:hypothetical protein
MRKANTTSRTATESRPAPSARQCAAGCRPPAVRTYLPANLDLGAAGIEAEWRDYAAFVVGGLYLRRHLVSHREPDDYHPLSSRVLKEVLPGDYRRILKALCEGGVIECETNSDRVESYRVGHRSKAYRIRDPYRDAPFRSHDLRHAELVRKVHARREREAAGYAGCVHGHLREMLDRVEVVGDVPHDSLQLRLLADREPYFAVCRQGRVHTPLTSLRREDRRHLRVDGEPLWQLDVVNSQPFLLGVTLMSDVIGTNARFQAYRDYLGCKLTHSNLTPSQAPLIPPLTSPYPYVAGYSHGCAGDADDYVGLCQRGQIYERLSEFTGLSRDAVKDELFAVVYGNPRKSQFTPLGQVFRYRFSPLWRGVLRFADEPAGELARLMQTVESFVVVWNACHAIAARFHRAPLLTIHDSLVTTEEHLQAFGEVLKAEFRAAVGVEPMLKVSPL